MHNAMHARLDTHAVNQAAGLYRKGLPLDVHVRQLVLHHCLPLRANGRPASGSQRAVAAQCLVSVGLVHKLLHAYKGGVRSGGKSPLPPRRDLSRLCVTYVFLSDPIRSDPDSRTGRSRRTR